LKNVGDEVQPGDVLASIETDKAVVDFEMQEEGYVAKLLYPEGAKDVPLGKIVAILVDNKDDIAAFANYDESADSGSAPAEATPAPVQEASQPVQAAPSKDYPDHIALEMPNLSPTMEKGNIQKWNKQVGDEVQPGDVLASVETDKAVVDFEMQEEGYVAKLLYPEGAKDVPLRKIVAVLVDNKDDIAAFSDYTGEASAAPVQEAAPAQQEAAQTAQPAAQASSAPATAVSGDRVFASPLAKKIAAEKGIDLSQVQGTGPNNRIIEADVLEFKAPVQQAVQQAAPSTPAAPQAQQVDMPPSLFQDHENSTIRKIIAQRLTESK